MKLVLFRHAHAGDREEFSVSDRPDSERPLSDKGHEQARGAVHGLKSLVPDCDVIATSPFVRAVETAAIVAGAYDGMKPVTTTALEPSRRPAEFAKWLESLGNRDVVIAVGHEPQLGKLATWLVTDTDGEIELRKAGACMISLNGHAVYGAGVLRWLKGPGELAAAVG